MLSLCSELGVPIAEEKCEGPATRITFLGIQIDTERWHLRLPDDKLRDLLGELRLWADRKKCTKRELLSLIGKLSFAAKAVPAGRLFFRRLINLSTKARRLHHYLHLNAASRMDILWWRDFLPLWNGRAPILDTVWTPANSLQLYTDASAKLGFGAYFQGSWFRAPWKPKQDHRHKSIEWQELFAIVAAAIAWGRNWSGRRIMFHCDNHAVVDMWRNQSSRCPQLLKLLHKLFFVAACNNFHVRVSHIQGVANGIADSLSRNQASRFQALAPDAEATMTPIPEEVFTIY